MVYHLKVSYHDATTVRDPTKSNQQVLSWGLARENMDEYILMAFAAVCQNFDLIGVQWSQSIETYEDEY
jgi:hypothetical protein